MKIRPAKRDGRAGRDGPLLCSRESSVQAPIRQPPATPYHFPPPPCKSETGPPPPSSCESATAQPARLLANSRLLQSPVLYTAPASFFYGWHALMMAARARLMFSSEARAFLRSGDPRLVRTSPSDTVRNSADNSLSLRSSSSWFEISFMFSSFCLRPRSSGPFMKKRPPDAKTELSTNCTVIRRGLLVAPAGWLGAAYILRRPMRDW